MQNVLSLQEKNVSDVSSYMYSPAAESINISISLIDVILASLHHGACMNANLLVFFYI